MDKLGNAQSMLDNALKEANKKLKEMPPPSKGKDEVNFDDISSDSSEDEEMNEPKDDSTSDVEPEEKFSLDERLVRAESAKMSGNECFKKKENTEAITFYNKGLKVLEPIEKETSLPSDYKSKYETLYISLLLNKSATTNRLKTYKETIRCCTMAEKKTFNKKEYEGSHIKCLLRRSIAYISTNEISSAKTDLLGVLKLNPKNGDALRELRKIKTNLVEEKKRAKSTFGNIFNKNTNIYKDKEAQQRRRQEKLKKENSKKRKNYEKEKEKSEVPEEFMSFEDWDKKKQDEAKAEEEKKLKEKEKKDKEREAKRRKKIEEERKRKIDLGLDPDADEVELDEEDLAAIADVKKKGYCHFRREKTEDEKELLSHITPSKLTGDSGNDLQHLATGGSEHSAWNKAKTWEERDVSEDVKTELKQKLKTIRVKKNAKSVEFDVFVDKVDSVNGEAQVVFVNGKKGAVYDMNLEIKFKIKVTPQDKDTKSITGRLKFPEVANGIQGHSFEATKSFSKLNTLSDEEKQSLSSIFNEFETHCREKVFEIVDGQFSGTT